MQIDDKLLQRLEKLSMLEIKDEHKESVKVPFGGGFRLCRKHLRFRNS